MNRRNFLSHSGRMLLAAGLAPGLTTKLFAENSMPNQRRALSFSNDWIESSLITSVQNLPLDDAEAIVVNLSSIPLYYSVAADHAAIPPWKSTILRHCTLEKGERAALLHVRKRTNLGGVALNWEWFGQRFPQFPRGTPLYISSQDDIGDVELDPLITFAGQSVPASPRRYRLKLNLWYTPEETDCTIHTGHKFLEVHTQVLGTGHMQKFRENDEGTLYEDVLMPPGFTHDPFFTVAASDRSFTYPWHRYYADTDCVWMAVELHPE
jgi:hypothetical protein